MEMNENNLPCGCLRSIHHPIADFGNTAICFDFTVHAAFTEYLFYKGSQEKKWKTKIFYRWMVCTVYIWPDNRWYAYILYSTHIIPTFKELQTKRYIKINKKFLDLLLKRTNRPKYYVKLPKLAIWNAGNHIKFRPVKKVALWYRKNEKKR